jgi:hypothetical protein
MFHPLTFPDTFKEDSMTDHNRTATVVALTAEVRVLMVGSRQITMSVANQLDHADPAEVEPFGRVRMKDAERVIGRHAPTGNLVLAGACAGSTTHFTGLDDVRAGRFSTTGLFDVQTYYRSFIKWRKCGSGIVWPCPCRGADPTCPFQQSLPIETQSYGVLVATIPPELPGEVFVGCKHLGRRHLAEATGCAYGRAWLNAQPLVVLAGLR